MKPEYAISITMFIKGVERHFKLGETMASGKIKAIEVRDVTVCFICEDGKIVYSNIPFIAKFENK